MRPLENFMQNGVPPLPEDERPPDARGAEGMRDVQGAPYTVGPELDPALRLEKELLTKIAGVIENNAETSGPINTDPAIWLDLVREFKIIPPALFKIISINPGTLEPTKPTPDAIAEALSKFIFDLTGKITFQGARSRLATAILECVTFDQLDELLVITNPERYASPPSPRVADSKALDYTMYYFRLYGPIMRTRGESCYVYGPRFVASRWVDERNADIALSAFYESVPATGIKALQEMDLMMRNGRDKFFDPTFGGFDLADFTRFRLEKRKLPPDGVCKTESFAVFVSW